MTSSQQGLPADRSGDDSFPFVLHARTVTSFGGGPEKTILNSPRHLRSHQYDSLCLYLHPPGDPGLESLRGRAEGLQAPFLSVADRGPLDLGSFKQIVSTCREKKVDIWHGHDYKTDVLGLLVRPFRPMKLVTTIHGWGVQATRRTPTYVWIDKWSLRFYDAVICVSQEIFDECESRGVARDRLQLIHNGIDILEYSRVMDKAQAKAAIGAQPGRILLGSVGRLSGEKGFDLLIRACASLVSREWDLDLWIAGEGSCRKELEALIAELGLSDRVRLLGNVSDPRQFFEAMDLFVLSSTSEGLPNVLLEAMALEVPAVATRVGQVPRVIEDGVDGVLVDPGDQLALEEGIRKVLRSDIQSPHLAAAGRRKIVQEYSFDSRMMKISKVYDQVLKGSRG